MTPLKVALLGLGTVGFGTFEALKERKDDLEQILGRKIEISGILIKDKSKDRGLDQNIFVSKDFKELLSLKKPDVIIEAIGGIEPALQYIEYALRQGCHVISANKDCIAKHGTRLKAIAEDNAVRFVYEASVGGGIPILRTLRELLVVNKVERIEAILNGTSNFILTSMRVDGHTFEEALSIAREKGFAEQDPANDIEGRDAFYKAMIICEELYGQQPDWDHVNVQGIKNIKKEEIRAAEQLGLRVKHLVTIRDTLKVTISPVFIDSSHPLYNVEQVNNGVVIKNDLLGYLTLIGAGAGAKPTASAIVEDFMSLFLTKHFKRLKTYPEKFADIHKEQDETNVFFFRNVADSEKNRIVNDLEEAGTVHSSTGGSGSFAVLYSGKRSDFQHEKLVSKYPAKISLSATQKTAALV
ncbi:homoserine dehydrogenase [Peribacillus sp. SCS-155]|uniref:homoserine dehydrogenase n=1 Tax=Peribacillus sedimenti TaxID=3115297 RepID=UPI003905E7D8